MPFMLFRKTTKKRGGADDGVICWYYTSLEEYPGIGKGGGTWVTL